MRQVLENEREDVDTTHLRRSASSNQRDVKMSADASSNDPQVIPIPITNKYLFETRGLVAGSFKAAADSKSFPVYEPSSGNILQQCSDFGRQDFVDAIDVADQGYRNFWSSTTAKERGGLLRRWYEQILENVDDCT